MVLIFHIFNFLNGIFSNCIINNYTPDYSTNPLSDKVLSY